MSDYFAYGEQKMESWAWALKLREWCSEWEMKKEKIEYCRMKFLRKVFSNNEQEEVENLAVMPWQVNEMEKRTRDRKKGRSLHRSIHQIHNSKWNYRIVKKKTQRNAWYSFVCLHLARATIEFHNVTLSYHALNCLRISQLSRMSMQIHIRNREGMTE